MPVVNRHSNPDMISFFFDTVFAIWPQIKAAVRDKRQLKLIAVCNNETFASGKASAIPATAAEKATIHICSMAIAIMLIVILRLPLRFIITIYILYFFYVRHAEPNNCSVFDARAILVHNSIYKAFYVHRQLIHISGFSG